MRTRLSVPPYDVHRQALSRRHSLAGSNKYLKLLFSNFSIQIGKRHSNVKIVVGMPFPTQPILARAKRSTGHAS